MLLRAKKNKMENTDLTDEWIEYDGKYCKATQDIKLHTGRELYYCWPNAGYFTVLNLQNKVEKIPESEVAYVRKAHFRRFYDLVD